jgi:hypothetical protein
MRIYEEDTITNKRPPGEGYGDMDQGKKMDPKSKGESVLKVQKPLQPNYDEKPLS